MRGNVLDLAVAVILGGAFGKIVTSLVNDVLMPPLGLLLGKVDFSNLYINLSGKHFDSLAEAQKAGVPTINYGMFLNVVVGFLIVSFVIYLIVRASAHLQKAPEAPKAAPSTKECNFCFSTISIRATRCPHCTSQL